MNRFLTVLLCCLGFLIISPAYSVTTPVMWLKFHAYVNDYAHMLSPEIVNHLNHELANYNAETTNQIVVTTLNSIGDDSVEEVANHLFHYNGIGTKENDNGVLLLIVKDGHHIRIEVGYGLEGELTDAMSGMIIRNDIAPYFKQQAYGQGIEAGVQSIQNVINGTYKAKTNHHVVWVNFIGGPIFIIIFICLFVFSMVRNYKANGWKGVLLGLLFSRINSSNGTYTRAANNDDDSFSGGGGDSGGGGASGRW